MPSAIASISDDNLLIVADNGDVLQVERTTHKATTIRVRLLSPGGISSVAVDGEALRTLAKFFARVSAPEEKGNA
jgi:hypothetical protein